MLFAEFGRILNVKELLAPNGDGVVPILSQDSNAVAPGKDAVIVEKQKRDSLTAAPGSHQAKEHEHHRVHFNEPQPESPPAPLQQQPQQQQEQRPISQPQPQPQPQSQSQQQPVPIPPMNPHDALMQTLPKTVYIDANTGLELQSQTYFFDANTGQQIGGPTQPTTLPTVPESSNQGTWC